MSLSVPSSLLSQMREEVAHFDAAPAAFLHAWKRGVEIAGVEWFGNGVRMSLLNAKSTSDLQPNMLAVSDALNALSPGERRFLSVMVSFYNAREGGAMLKRCNFEGLADLGRFDLPRRKVIADLILHYVDW